MADSTEKTADALFNIDETYTFSIKGFTYIKEFAMLVFKNPRGNGNLKIIVGDKRDFPMSEMLLVKGNDAEIIYKGEVTVNDKMYHRFNLECIC